MSDSLAEYNAEMQEVAARFADKFVTAIGDAIQSHEEAMRKAIEDAVRWDYFSQRANELCFATPYESSPSYIAILEKLEACIPSDVERLKAEAEQWAGMVFSNQIGMTGYDLTTWEKAQALLAERQGQGDD